MIAVNNRQYLSVITATGGDIHVSVTALDNGLGRGHTHNNATVITEAVATPGTEILAGPDSASASWEVDNISIRNIDSISQTVTVCLVSTDDAGTRTVVQLHKATIAGGDEVYYEGHAGWTLVAASTGTAIGNWDTYVVASNVVNQTADVLANVTGLTAAVTTGYVYEFDAQLPYTSGASTTGVRFVVNGPAKTFINGVIEYPLGTATTFTKTTITDYQIPNAANADTLAANGIGRIHGFVKPSADGTFAIQVASENNTQPITVLAGATLMIRRVL